jgi:hypothetical protein
MKKIILFAMVAVLAVACNSNTNKAQEEFDKIVEQALNIEISNDKVVASFNQNISKDFEWAFLYNDDREDVVEVWGRYNKKITYYKGETVGWLVGYGQGNDIYAFPVKSPCYGIIENENYSWERTEYDCLPATMLDNSGVLFVMQTDSVAICKEYMNSRRAKISLEELERDRRIKQLLMQTNKLVRKTTDW